MYHAQCQVTPTLKRDKPFLIIINYTDSDSLEVIINDKNVAQDKTITRTKGSMIEHQRKMKANSQTRHKIQDQPQQIQQD